MKWKFVPVPIFVLVAVIGTSLAPPVAAQEQLVELLRTDLRRDKVAILTVALGLSDAEAAVFWPIYRQYEVELTAIGDRRLALIKRYAEGYDNLGNDAAKALSNDSFKLQEDRLKLWKKTYKSVEKALSATIATRFIQVENQIALLIDLQIAEELPLVQPVRK